ncbi:hypothetical protein MMC10_007929 [Thelotrema lepadinum]|nr:hypothetical protein [Thelotrema lepadinum]
MGALGHGGNGQFVLGQNTPGIWPQNSYPGYNGDDPWSVMQLRRTGPILPTSDLMDIDQDLALVNYMIEGEAPLLSYQRSIDRDTNNYPVEAPAPDSVPLDGPVLHTRQQYVIDSGNRTTNGMAQELSLRPQIQATLSATALDHDQGQFLSPEHESQLPALDYYTGQDETTKVQLAVEPGPSEFRNGDPVNANQEQHFSAAPRFCVYTKDMEEYAPTQKRRELRDRDETREIRRLGACKFCKSKKTKVGAV